MEYFSIIAEGTEACFQWLSMIKIGNSSILDISLLVLLFSLIWRFVLQPLFGGFGGHNSEKVNKKVKK